MIGNKDLKSDLIFSEKADVSLMFVIFLCRHLIYVHDCWTLYVETVSEETPRHQRKCLHRLRLPGCGHLLLCAWSGMYT